MTQSRPTLDDPLNAFCKDSDAYLPGAPDGPLSGLTFAAKDILDVAGYVTGGGNPDWKATHEPAVRTAWAVQTLVDAGATMVGKTITDELTRGIFGENVHYGTPINPRVPGRVPGGSSSGSVSAVAGGLVDFALGSDTGGSVRVQASFCGVFGLRPTHGRIPLDGILFQAPSYDTIGWFARDAEVFGRVGAVLLKSEIKEERPRRLLIAENAFEVADQGVADALKPIASRVASLVGDSVTERLTPTSLADWSRQQQVLQGHEAWQTARDWIDRVNPRFSFWVTDRYTMNRAISDSEVERAKSGTQRRKLLCDVRPGDERRACPDRIGAAPDLARGRLCAGLTRVSKRAAFLDTSSASGGPPRTGTAACIQDTIALPIELAVSRDLFAAILGRIARLRLVSGKR